MARFDQNKITFEDSNNVDQYEVELVNGTELKVTHLPTGNSWKFDDDNDGTLTANALEATNVLTAPKYPTRSDVPNKEGIYRVEDVDGEGNFGIIAREI